MNKKNIIIDCDPGVDDAVALLYAFKEKQFDIKLITTVAGNVSVDKTTTNAKGIVKLAGESIRVVQGAKRPLIGEPKFAEEIHGVTGLGTYAFENIDLSEHKYDNAPKEIIKELEKSTEKMIIVAIGPLTNIANVILMKPEIVEKIEYISIMGGSLKGGNHTIAAEFNFFVDPEAARVVFNSGAKIVMAGLDVTEKANLYEEQLNKVKEFGVVGKFVDDVIRTSPRKRFKDSLSQLNDVLSFMAITNLDMFDYKEMYVDVEISGHISRALTIGDQRKQPLFENNTIVLLDMNYDEFDRLLLERLSEYGK